MQLYEKYRPKTFAEVVGQEKIVAKIALLQKRGLAGRAYWFTGQSGTGKTTLARLLASEIAEDVCIQEIDASDCSLSTLREIEGSIALSGWGPKLGRAYIVNEAHGLRKDAIRQLLVILERLPQHVAFIFTTTNDGQDGLFEDNEDAGPLLSRCVRLELSRRELAKPFAERAREIAIAEGLDGKPIERYLKLVQEHRNNFRAVLQAIDSGVMMEE
ncbi:MAG: AAA family ATPase [Sterolibacterium sp.]